MAKSEDVHVTLSGAHTYRTGPSTTRTLPAGWSGYVAESVAKAIEKGKVGKRTPDKDKPWEGDKTTSGQGGTTATGAKQNEGSTQGGGAAGAGTAQDAGAGAGGQGGATGTGTQQTGGA